MTRPSKDDLNIVPSTYSFCRRCAARVELGRIAFGTTVTCPACGLEFAINRPQRNHDGAGQGGASGDEPQDDRRQSTWDAAGGGSLAKLLLSGTFSFPLWLENLLYTLTLCAGAVVLVGAWRLGAWCYSADGDQVDRMTRLLLANGLLFSLAFGSLALLAWSLLASAYGMTILRETAQGVDAVRDWPNLLALQEVGEIAYLAANLLVAALPGAMAIPLWNRLGVPLSWGIGGSIVVLFPITLLSTIDANSPAHPFSASIWKGLLCRWPAWLAFYLSTSVLGVAAVAVEIALRRHAHWATNAVLSGVVLALVWMIYFRLLGRLASACVFRPKEGV